jgi:hypothetical protein
MFNPDEFLAKTGDEGESAFDPDAFLEKHSGEGIPEPHIASLVEPAPGFRQVGEAIQSFSERMQPIEPPTSSPLAMGQSALAGVGELAGGLIGSVTPADIALGVAGVLKSLPFKVRPDISPVFGNKMIEVAQVDPVTALKNITPVSEWGKVDTLARDIARSAGPAGRGDAQQKLLEYVKKAVNPIEEIEAEAEKIGVLQEKIKARSMLYQADLKDEVGRAIGIPAEELDLAYDNWAKIRDAYKTGDLKRTKEVALEMMGKDKNPSSFPEMAEPAAPVSSPTPAPKAKAKNEAKAKSKVKAKAKPKPKYEQGELF